MSCFAISRLLRDPHASLVLLSWCTLKLLPKRLPLNHDCIELRTEEMQEFISWRTFVSLEASSWCNRFERRKTQAVYFMLRYPFLLSYLRGDHDEQDHDHLSCLSSREKRRHPPSIILPLDSPLIHLQNSLPSTVMLNWKEARDWNEKFDEKVLLPTTRWRTLSVFIELFKEMMTRNDAWRSTNFLADDHRPVSPSVVLTGG